MLNPIKLVKVLALGNKLEATAKENQPMSVKLPQILALVTTLSATIGLPTLAANWVHAHYAVYLGVVIAGIVLHAIMPSVFGAPSDADKKAVGLNGVGVLLFCLLLAPALGAQTPAAPTPVPAPAPTSIQNLYGAGVSYSINATPAIAGSALYAHQISADTVPGMYAFTVVDALPNTLKPFTITTNIGAGIAQKVVTLGKVPIFMPTAAGISFNGSNTGWQWNGGVLAAIHIKNQYYLMPTVRFLKSSVSNGTGYQPIIGLLFGWGQ